ncbi:hypothetical protein BKA70DRAFT_6034 [Coprinopsis sp. MPI-PUGE-AT-0042]|nr:hypothetical protein BKA70DRAFT_6034 [Coprinopsis sp. MPI-PUGE-AT-0042]
MPSPHHAISSRSNPTRDANSPQTYIASRSFGHKPAGESFRPKLLGLPKDPFAAKPWIVNLDVLPTSRIRQTILVLGTPPQSDVHSLVYSETLRDSLIIIATHDVKPLASPLLNPTEPNSSSQGPTTRILRLGSPLFPQYVSAPASRPGSLHGSLSPSTASLPSAPSSGGGSDALRVMSLLNRSSQVASSLALCNCGEGSASRIQQLGENPLTGEFNVLEVLGSASPASAGINPSRPTSIATSEQVTPKKSKRQTLHGFFSFGSSSSTSPGSDSSTANVDTGKFGPSPTAAIFQDGSPGCGSTTCGGGKATKGPCGGRAFDALINYLPSPSSIPEKIILKQAILVTTLSAPYLSGAGVQPPSRLDQKVRERRHTGTSMLGIPLSRRSTALSSDGHSVSSKLEKRKKPV